MGASHREPDPFQVPGQPGDELFQEWLAFVYDQQVLPGVQPVIARSWKRCWARVNPFQPTRFVHLNEEHLLSSQLASFDLLSVALPILEDILEPGENDSTAILFANSAGCVLELYGDEGIIKSLAACGIVKSAIFNRRTDWNQRGWAGAHRTYAGPCGWFRALCPGPA